MTRKRAAHPTDLSDAEWEALAPLVPPAKPGGRGGECLAVRRAGRTPRGPAARARECRTASVLIHFSRSLVAPAPSARKIILRRQWAGNWATRLAEWPGGLNVRRARSE